MSPLRTPAALLLAGSLTLAVTACGSDSGSDSDTPATTPSATSSGTPGGSSPAPSNSGIVPDAAWAQVMKKAVGPLDQKTDEEIVSAAEDACGDFTADPVKATATKVIDDLKSSLGLDDTQAQIFAAAAITHFCTQQTQAWTTAAIG